MRQCAGRITAAMLTSIALLCAGVACGGGAPIDPIATPDAPNDAATAPFIQPTVIAAETANAISFTAQTAAARAATAAVVALPLLPPPAAAAVASSGPLPATATRAPTLVVPVAGYTAAFPVVTAADLAAQPDHYNGMRISLVGHAYDVHAAKGTTTFFLADDDAHTHRAFVSYEGADANVQENAAIQVYGIGAKTIHVVSGIDQDADVPFVTAVLIRTAR